VRTKAAAQNDPTAAFESSSQPPLSKMLRRPLESAQFTGVAFTGVLLDRGVSISMDGKGAWRDNGFVERLWRSVKYEEVYLKAYDTVSEARRRSACIWPSTINGARTRALTGARRTRPTSPRRPSRRRHEFSASRWTCLRFGLRPPSVMPSARNCKGQTPAAVHLTFAESCPDNRDQL
jgi:hypothetical protein